MGQWRASQAVPAAAVISVLLVVGACATEPEPAADVAADGSVTGLLDGSDGDDSAQGESSATTSDPAEAAAPRTGQQADDDASGSVVGGGGSGEAASDGSSSEDPAVADPDSGSEVAGSEVPDDVLAVPMPEGEAHSATPGGRALETTYDSRAELAADEPLLALLFPTSSELGSGWGDLYGSLASEMVLFDPASARQGELPADCEIDGPIRVIDGGYFEMGFEPSPDDAVVIVSRGNAAQMDIFYRRFSELIRCTTEAGGGDSEITERPDPVLPGVERVTRFAVDDEFGQHVEFVIARRDDLVWVFDVHEKEEADPIDFDAVALELMTRYHEAVSAGG